MTARTRSRTFLVGAAVAALAAPLLLVAALAAPADARKVGPRPHEVSIYKVEKHVDLSGEYPDNYLSTSLRCDGNDWAVDGMWRIDHVDQFNPSNHDPDDPDGGIYNDARDVIVYASYGDGADRAKWNFRLENHAQGNAQVKLFLTCLRERTEANDNHRHQMAISQRYADGSASGVLPAGHNQVDFNGDCGPGYVAVAPGFDFTHDTSNHISRSWPINSGRVWSWAFTTTEANPALTVYVRCMSKRVAAEFGHGASKKHTHKVPMVFRPHYNGGPQVSVGPKLTSVERRYDCDQNDGRYHAYKAMIGAFHINDPHHVWFYGMDPRPKQRAFRFFWDGAGHNTVYLAAHCVRSRTGKQIRP